MTQPTFQREGMLNGSDCRTNVPAIRIAFRERHGVCFIMSMRSFYGFEFKNCCRGDGVLRGTSQCLCDSDERKSTFIWECLHISSSSGRSVDAHLGLRLGRQLSIDR